MNKDLKSALTILLVAGTILGAAFLITTYKPTKQLLADQLTFDKSSIVCGGNPGISLTNQISRESIHLCTDEMTGQDLVKLYIIPVGGKCLVEYKERSSMHLFNEKLIKVVGCFK